MKTTINSVNGGTASVTFEHAGVTHTRDVNICTTAKGKYDTAATEARIAEIALGVEVKIATGAITNPPPVPEPTPAAE
ncbi:hypothetical protein [Sphingomonas pokkalii]|uniref:Uncharacterized protein n=1 Tax=Sphingomonas pokkalii TaxID=2175090 RepID=A0A2U0SI01_9SPHN|nr:hypothetical protein [Sphingomonas pokkalii]PVX30965.1 hypothetical protein DD559_17865 [Sphingomonas pokkalii]